MPDEHALRAWRKTHKVTLATLAAQTGVKAAHLSEIENGNNTPSLKLASRLSQATAGADGVPAVPLTEFVPQSEAAE